MDIIARGLAVKSGSECAEYVTQAETAASTATTQAGIATAGGQTATEQATIATNKAVDSATSAAAAATSAAQAMSTTPAGYNDFVAQVNADRYRPYVKPTLTGNAINIKDSAELPLQAMTIDSTSSVDVTVCGKNLIDKTTVKRWNPWWFANAGTVFDIVNGTMVNVNSDVDTNAYIVDVEDNITLTASNSFVTRYAVYYLDQNNVVLINASWGTFSEICTLTTPPLTAKIVLFFWNQNGTEGERAEQLEYGTTATAYEPYTSQTVTVTNGGNEWQSLHTYYGTSNITNSINAQMSVTYCADTKLYIDNKFSELSNAIVATAE